MRLAYSFQRDGGVTDVELFVDMEWLRIVAHRAVGNKRRRSKYAFASARVIGRRRYKNSNQSLELGGLHGWPLRASVPEHKRDPAHSDEQTARKNPGYRHSCQVQHQQKYSDCP